MRRQFARATSGTVSEVKRQKSASIVQELETWAKRGRLACTSIAVHCDKIADNAIKNYNGHKPVRTPYKQGDLSVCTVRQEAGTDIQYKPERGRGGFRQPKSGSVFAASEALRVCSEPLLIDPSRAGEKARLGANGRLDLALYSFA